MDVLTVLLLGVVVSGITQTFKSLFPKVDPKLWVALLALVGATFWAIVVPLLPIDLVKTAGVVFATAISFYEVLKSFIPKSK